MFTRSKKNKILFIVVAVAVTTILVSAGTAIAGGGWHGGGWHGGGHWHGGWGWGWPYYGLGLATGAFLSYPYYYGYPYYAYGPSYPYYSPQQQPSVYVEPAPQAQEQAYWYFCPDARNYYPYVKRCPSGWLKVIPPSEPEDGGE